MEDYYEPALKAGLKYYRLHALSGADPNLPVLNDLLPESMIASGTDIGLMNVPAEKIVGTVTAGRSKCFAGNFMPVARAGTEFAIKWKQLALSHQKEGIRDAVLLYEYMNNYYVQEGNKRVSVLKFFHAVSVPGIVRRILPERNGDPKVEAYYEYLEFCKSTGITFLEFSSQGAYAEFCELMGHIAGTLWTEEEIRQLKSTYYFFCKVFQSAGGDKLQVGEGDALLACIRVLGYDYLSGLSEPELKTAMKKVREEILLQKEDTKIEMKLNPEEQSQNVLSKLRAPKNLKAAFLYMQENNASGWVTGHELARKQVEGRLSGKVETTVYRCDEEKDIEAQLDKAVADGADVIFATSSVMLPACLKKAIDTPNVAIMNCSVNKPHRYVRAYYPRMYEGKFVAGAVAGALCTDDQVGYICKYPVYGSIADINAFARGVKMTNPRAKVHLEWLSRKSEKDPLEMLTEKGISLVSVDDYRDKEKGIRHLFGLEQVEKGVFTPLVLPVWNWSVYYEWILNSMLNGTYKIDTEKTRRSLQYYWGMSSGAVKLLFAERLPQGVRFMAELLSRSISDGVCNPFYEPDVKADGHPDWADLDRLPDLEHILEMDELEENVVGEIPCYEELTERAQSVVDVIGLAVSRKRAEQASVSGKEEA